MFAEEIPYIKSEPLSDYDKKLAYWHSAIGLQAVDNLKTSAYLDKLIERNLNNEITSAQVETDLIKHYTAAETSGAYPKGSRLKEADLVTARIENILEESSCFELSLDTYMSINGYLFKGFYPNAGKIRDYYITKPEPILNNNTVQYGGVLILEDLLIKIIDKEKSVKFLGQSLDATLERLQNFIIDIWKQHPFCEGNTRTTAVLLQMYLISKGIKVKNDIFKDNSLYFRNALVRSCYEDAENGIFKETVFLKRFLENMITGTNYELKNRYLYVPEYFPKYTEQLSQAVEDIRETGTVNHPVSLETNS